MGKILSAIGIVFVAVGTILSIWTVLVTKVKDVGTYNYNNGDNQQREFKKQKVQVIVGIGIISIGSIIQCVGLFL